MLCHIYVDEINNKNDNITITVGNIVLVMNTNQHISFLAPGV